MTLGPNTLLIGEGTFRQFRSAKDPALTLGSHCTMEEVRFGMGFQAEVHIGDYCYFTNAVLLCESELRIGSYVVIGWNATIADADWHPIGPAERVADAIACSPIGHGRSRPASWFAPMPVTIGDDVWIGPNAMILKGVSVGAGAFIEPGAVVSRDVPPGARVAGNPAKVVGKK